LGQAERHEIQEFTAGERGLALREKQSKSHIQDRLGRDGFTSSTSSEDVREKKKGEERNLKR